jgi:transposase
MSIAHEAATQDSPFLRRFDTLWARLRRVRLGRVLALGALMAAGAFALLCALDYWLEWSRGARAASLALAAAGVAAWLGTGVRRHAFGLTRPRTAADIERAFPELGQSVRTTVQYSTVRPEEMETTGVRGALVGALRDETHARSRSLNFDEIVPVATVWRLVAVFGAAVLGMLAVGARDPEWRVAAGRALLAETPYTELEVAPGDVKIDQGASVDVVVRVIGRPRETVTLWTRDTAKEGSEWTERDLVPDAAKAGDAGGTANSYAAKIEGIKHPVDYRVTAGPAESPVHRVGVRYPLAIKAVSVELTPPAYTLQAAKSVADPNLSVLEGTQAKFSVTFDQPPRTASLLVAGFARGPDRQVPEPRAVPLQLAGVTGTATLDLTEDFKYSILAETEDGLRLPENSYRVRVRPDQPPEVYFEEPRDGLDVHTLAEILMRARVRDDYGLARAGIVFEVNNEEEYPLVALEFPITAEAIKEQGRTAPELQAALEKVLPLEFFQLQQTDSVAYYAWVEDNRPDKPQRTVTDLRFVDIRPFRIRYSVRDADPIVNGASGPRIATLEEIIKRQRANLNRSMNFQRQDERGSGVDPSALEMLVANETEIAQATRQLADFLGNFMNDDLNDEIQLLLQAESHMLAAADSLAAGKYETAVLQQRDALKELIEGRNRLRVAIMKNPAKFRAFATQDRMLAQKLRRPKSDAEEAAEVARRLEQLANSQMAVGATLMAAMTGEGTPPPDAKTDSENPTGTGGTPAGENKPGEAKPGESKPDDSQPTENKPGENKPGENKPGEAKPSETQPEDAAPNDAKPDLAASAAELRDKQTDNVLEARDLKAAVEKLKNITDLAKERAAKGTMQIEEADQALERGDKPTVVARSDEAAGTLRELAAQIRALAKEEAAEQLNQAREMARRLAEEQQQLAMGSSAQQPQGGKGSKSKGANRPAGKKEGEDPPKPGGGGQGEPQSDMPTPGAGKPADDAEKNPSKDGAAGGKNDADKNDSDKTGDKPGDGDDKDAEKKDGDKQGGEAAKDGDKPKEGDKPKDGQGGQEPADNPGQKGAGEDAEKPNDDNEAEGGAGMTPEQAARKAEQNAETGKTILDILKAAARSQDPADRDTVARVESILKDQGVEETVERMAGVAAGFRDGREKDARTAAADNAERWEAAASRLETAFRELSAPKLEELLEAEKELQTLQEMLEDLQTERDVSNWHARAERLLKKLDDLKVGGEMREELEKLMKGAGWSKETARLQMAPGGWALSEERRLYAAPSGYHTAVRKVTEAVQSHIQELLLGDLAGTDKESAPPEYERLIERYYQVLSKQRRPERMSSGKGQP